MPSEIIELGHPTPEMPGDNPRYGARRVVKMVEMPWKAWAPCIWRSPVDSIVESTAGRWCVVLADKGSPGQPAPRTAAAFVPNFVWAQLPEETVEW